MEITTGLMAKVGAGLVLLGGGSTAIYFGNDYLSNSISRYDTALIDFLKKGNGNNDIIFEVKKGADSGSDTDLTDSGLSFSSTGTISPIKIKVTANTSTPNTTFKTSGNAPTDTDLADIKQLTKSGSGWIWECSFQFVGEGENINGKSIKDDYKNRILKSDGLGLFGLLKKDTSSYTDSTDNSKWTKKEIIQVKSDFIQKCGQAREIGKNRKLNKEKAENNDIKVGEISIKFKVEEGGTNLVPTDKATFDYWFIDTDKTYNG